MCGRENEGSSRISHFAQSEPEIRTLADALRIAASDSSRSTTEEEGVPVAASATVTRTAGRGTDRGRTQRRAPARGARRGKIQSLYTLHVFIL